MDHYSIIILAFDIFRDSPYTFAGYSPGNSVSKVGYYSMSLLKEMRDFLIRHAKGKTVLILLLITLVVYSYMLFYSIPHVMDYAGGMKLLDMQPTGYTPKYVHALFENLGQKGRDAYLFRQIPVDMLYPLLFAMTYSLMLAFLFQRAFKPDAKIQYLCMTPILAGAFDYLENAGIVIMLIDYPRLSDFLASLTNIFSLMKSLFTFIFFALFLFAIIAILTKRIRRS